MLKIFDSTTGSLFRSTQVTLTESAVNEILPGVEQKGVKTNVVLGVVGDGRDCQRHQFAL